MEDKKMGDPMKRPQTAKSPTRPGVDSFRDDSLYPRIVRTMEALLARGTVVAPIDVLIGMGLLTQSKVDDWRVGRVPYLEHVIGAKLVKLSRLLRILRFHAHDLKLCPSMTRYVRLGQGPKAAPFASPTASSRRHTRVTSSAWAKGGWRGR